MGQGKDSGPGESNSISWFIWKGANPICHHGYAPLGAYPIFIQPEERIFLQSCEKQRVASGVIDNVGGKLNGIGF
jgi:hypothetical protein